MEGDGSASTTYDEDTETATFEWERVSGSYTQQQITWKTDEGHVTEYDYCGAAYDGCYNVNLTDTSASFVITKEAYDASNFSLVVLQLDDEVVNTPFAKTVTPSGEENRQ